MPQIPPPAYLVISAVEFLPNQQVALRRGDNSRVAILVFEEEGELRMTLAPTELQPEPDDEDTAISTGPTSAPSYPWEQDGDY